MKSIFNSTDPGIFNTHKILKFENLYDYFAVRKLFLELNNPNSQYFPDRISDLQSNHSYPTRFISNLILISPFCTRTSIKSGYLYQAINSWNKLPFVLKTCNNYNKFSRIYKKFILDQYHAV